jgi:hypothetical protein
MTASPDTLEAQVERVRSAMLARHGYEPGASLPIDRLRSPIDDVERLARVSAHWGIASDLPLVGRPLVLFRRVIRIALRWYINPIVDQQNAFNEAVVRALNELSAENETLRSKLIRRDRVESKDRVAE